jgi:hypothetical protein
MSLASDRVRRGTSVAVAATGKGVVEAAAQPVVKNAIERPREKRATVLYGIFMDEKNTLHGTYKYILVETRPMAAKETHLPRRHGIYPKMNRSLNGYS